MPILMKYSMSTLVATVVLLLTACSQNLNHLHQTDDASLPKNIAIQGYSAVSYFEKNAAEVGSAEFKVEHRGRTYYFTSNAQLDTFTQSPEAYMPKYGEYCPYSLALGRRVAIDPTNFKIHDGQLLLFHDSVELHSVDVAEQRDIFERADRKFKLISF